MINFLSFSSLSLSLTTLKTNVFTFYTDQHTKLSLGKMLRKERFNLADCSRLELSNYLELSQQISSGSLKIDKINCRKLYKFHMSLSSFVKVLEDTTYKIEVFVFEREVEKFMWKDLSNYSHIRLTPSASLLHTLSFLLDDHF